jgi:ubiquinone biosynthesis protein UbiJ
LRVRYDQVSRWLSSCAPAAFVADTAAARPFSEQGVDGLSQPAGRVPAGDLTDRVNDLMATLRQVSRESREREEKLYRIIEVERAAAREQAARRDAELDQLRSVVDKLAERVARLDAPEPSAWRRVWRQGAGR